MLILLDLELLLLNYLFIGRNYYYYYNYFDLIT